MNRERELENWLIDLREFLENQADAEYKTDSPSPVPNDAMRLLVTLKQLFPESGQ